jgi:hypothetical protein
VPLGWRYKAVTRQCAQALRLGTSQQVEWIGKCRSQNKVLKRLEYENLLAYYRIAAYFLRVRRAAKKVQIPPVIVRIASQ